MEAVFFRWNDDTEKLADIDGYFLPGGFSYEDRGRAGMISARDPIMEFIKEEAAKGKVVIGNCNGAQILVESGLIPNAQGLQMSLAKNAVGDTATGFLSEWVWITPQCPKDRCATANWEGVIHLPIAHAEGRFTTKDNAVFTVLMDNGQLAFSYCDEKGEAAQTQEFNPNGSEFATAGICNVEGNVVALMPHPERTPNGSPYFASMRNWIETHQIDSSATKPKPSKPEAVSLPKRKPAEVEIFIDTIIVNNEERTVEQAAKRLVPSITLKQMRYLSIPDADVEGLLSTISLFNPNKEVAYIRRSGETFVWDADTKQEVPADSVVSGDVNLLRRDQPDTGAVDLGKGNETGVCYICTGVVESDILKKDVLEIFGNPHSSTLELL